MKKILADSNESQIFVDQHDQLQINEIRDCTLEVFMRASVLRLHAVRVVRTPHGVERQLHLKVRVRCGRTEVVADVLLDTWAQVSLGWKGQPSDTCLTDSD